MIMKMKSFGARKLENVNAVVAGKIATSGKVADFKKIKEFVAKFDAAISRISAKVASFLRKWLVLGIVLLIVAKIVPEFPAQYPTIYKVGTAGLGIVEFIYKTIINFFGCLVTGRISWLPETMAALRDSIGEVFEWLASTHF